MQGLSLKRRCDPGEAFLMGIAISPFTCYFFRGSGDMV